MTNHDLIFKELLTLCFPDFIELFLPHTAAYLDETSLVFLDKEIFADLARGETYAADLVVKARFRESDAFFLIHTETQAKAEADFPRRMFRYFSRLYENHGLPVYPIALFSFRHPLSHQPSSHQVSFPDMNVLCFRYRVIQLNRLDYRKYLRRRNPVAAALIGTMNVARTAYPKVKLECMKLLSGLDLDQTRKRLVSLFIDTYLPLTDKEEAEYQERLAKMSKPEQEAIMELTTSWKQEGIREGLEQGLQQGLQRGALQLVDRQLRRKFGEEINRFRQKLERLSLERLEELSEALLAFEVPEDLDQWLEGS